MSLVLAFVLSMVGPMLKKPLYPFHPSQSYLYFDFTDGVRGGRGKIKGMADYHEGSDDPLRLSQECGLTWAQKYYPGSHHFAVSGLSTESDIAIVQCFRDKTYRHFPVYAGHLDEHGRPYLQAG